MAKKAKKQATPKKRKSTTSPPKEAEEGQILGTVSIPVLCECIVPTISEFDELVIEWGCLGLSEEPDKISERSANHRLLDDKRPPTTDDEGLHVYFSPPLRGAGSYGFEFVFTYNEAVEARTAPKEEEEDEGPTPEQEEGERVTGGGRSKKAA